MINSDKPKRITETSLLNKLPKKLVTKQLLGRLPKTFSLLTELLESWEQFRLRRIDFTVRKLREDGSTITKTKINKGASIKKQFITPTIEEYIQNILKNNSY